MEIKKCEEKDFVSFNLDDLSEDEKEKFFDRITKESGIEKFKGHIKHVYSYEKLGYEDVCPLCASDTKVYYADFIYATDIAPRVMHTLDFFCAGCPTVIVSEEFIRNGITGGFKYQGVLGLDYGKSRTPDLIETWNGEKPVFIFNEDQVPIGITTDVDLESRVATQSALPSSVMKIKKQKARKKMIRKSKKKTARKNNPCLKKKSSWK
ncbi:MAG: hypothetical protein HF978_03750 [Desulfobacteraceae bacterium]|nr:hypothetical protein [Desulfobacteraceae bacterium]MBC2754641.1 hypothetical protein [Desulfobacteraceae bacterium]